jgi:hypothetical protein
LDPLQDLHPEEECIALGVVSGIEVGLVVEGVWVDWSGLEVKVETEQEQVEGWALGQKQERASKGLAVELSEGPVLAERLEQVVREVQVLEAELDRVEERASLELGKQEEDQWEQLAAETALRPELR